MQTLSSSYLLIIRARGSAGDLLPLRLVIPPISFATWLFAAVIVLADAACKPSEAWISLVDWVGRPPGPGGPGGTRSAPPTPGLKTPRRPSGGSFASLSLELALLVVAVRPRSRPDLPLGTIRWEAVDGAGEAVGGKCPWRPVPPRPPDAGRQVPNRPLRGRY